ncbi:MAG TPA: hypothetical protein VMG10_28765 [Gemmataceae bacterium]|nr:hypothetical protein [Gemmataceae bacterium]
MNKAIIDKTNTAEKPVAERAKSAFISAPQYLDTSAVRKELENRGVTVFSPDELDLPGRNRSEFLQEAMQRADLVVAIVDSTTASNFVFFEAGFAQAMRKPTFVLLTGDASSTPWLSSGIPYFRFDPEKSTGLDFGISQILAIAHHGKKPLSQPTKRTHPLGDQAIDLLHQLHEMGGTIASEQLETLIAAAIRASGVANVSEANGTDRGLDFAVWAEDLSPWLGNPIAVQLRLNIRNTADAAQAIRELAQAMTRSDIAWGVLIYLTATIDLDHFVCMPNVLVVSAERFLEGLQHASFADLVRRLRHQRIHGCFLKRSLGFTRQEVGAIDPSPNLGRKRAKPIGA